MFDWVSFLEHNAVEYVPGTRGNVELACPFCGQADVGHHHMSVSLEGKGWKCWRDPDHRGRSPVSLVRALVGCSFEQARHIVGVGAAVSADVFAEVELLLGEPRRGTSTPTSLSEPREFKKFSDLPSSRPFVNYMGRRGFSSKFLRLASRDMGLRYCTRGPFAGRVVFLVYFRGALVTWTGRTLSRTTALRYKVLSADPEVASGQGLPVAALSIDHCLLWYDDLMAGGDVMWVSEGPMDALKLRMLRRHATCLFTSSPSRHQVDLLRDLAPRFRRRVVLLDRGAEAKALQVVSDLVTLGFEVGWLPDGVDDPGELTPAMRWARID